METVLLHFLALRRLPAACCSELQSAPVRAGRGSRQRPQVISNASAENPTVTRAPSVTIGRLSNRPSDASIATIASSGSVLTFSFMFRSRYCTPLRLRKSVYGRPLLAMSDRNSAADGGLVVMSISAIGRPGLARDFLAFTD